MTALLAIALAVQDPPDPARIREVRDRILADERFHTGPRRPTWGEVLARWIGRLLRDLLGGLGIRPGSATWWTVLVVSLVLLGAILAHVGLVLYRALRRPPQAGEGPPAQTARAADDPDAALRRAREAAGRSAWREAFSWIYRAGLLALRRRGALVLRDGTTAREFLRQLGSGGDPALHPAFDALVGDYEHVVFGHRDPPAGAAARWISHVEGWLAHG